MTTTRTMRHSTRLAGWARLSTWRRNRHSPTSACPASARRASRAACTSPTPRPSSATTPASSWSRCSPRRAGRSPPATSRRASRSRDRGASCSSSRAGVRAAIATCGGISPGLNDVIRSLVLELTGRYGVVQGLRRPPRLPRHGGARRARAADAGERRAHPPARRHGARHLPGHAAGAGDRRHAGRATASTSSSRSAATARCAARSRSPRRSSGDGCRSRWSACPRRSTTTSPGCAARSASRPRSTSRPRRCAAPTSRRPRCAAASAWSS